MESETATGPLLGIKVIELAHVMAGPTCGRMLADMGADVIKVERVPGGDSLRQDTFSPKESGNDTHAFMMMNRNKRGIGIDLKSKAGQATLERLLSTADVLIENFRHDTLEKLGFGYEDVHKRHPQLIYCSVSGYGRTGPYAKRGGFDLIAQGMSGLMSYTGEGKDRPPVKVGAPVTDITSGILAAMGVSAALHSRNQTGVGQLVDTSLYETGITFSYWHSAISFATGDCPGALGSAHPINTPYQAYQTADGWINIGGANQANWLRFLDVIEAPELKSDPRFGLNVDRMANKPALDQILTEYLQLKSSDQWLSELEAAGIPAGPIRTVPEMHQDPHAIAREMITSTEHKRLGTVQTIGFPVKFSETPGAITQPAPVLGQHTRDILRENGFDDLQIQKLIDDGDVIAE